MNLKRFDFSLARVRERYPEGCPARVIAAALMIAEEDVDDIYQKIVCKLQQIMGVC